jgi:linoleoyl-CoA desaturase
MATPKFATQKQSFHTELKKRINDYFTSSEISTTGNYKLYLKAAVLLIGFSATYIHLVFFTPPGILALLESGIVRRSYFSYWIQYYARRIAREFQ